MKWRPSSLAVALVCCSAISAVASDELDETALVIAPDNVAFFSTSVNMKDGWEDFANSRLVQRLQAVPYVQQLIAEGQQQWDNAQGPVAQAKAAISNPFVRNALKMAQDMFSDELFVYGDGNWADAIRGYLEFNNKMAYQMSQDPEGLEEYFQTQMLRDLAELEIPTTVMGFRVEDAQNAMLQLNALDGVLRALTYQVPELKPVLERLKRTDLDDGMTLSISVDTSLLPIDQMAGEEKRVAEMVDEMMKGRSLTVSIGVRDGILLAIFCEGESVIETFSPADKPLLDHEAMTVLKNASPTRLRSVAYTSADFRNAAYRASMENYFSRISAQMIAAIRKEADGEPALEEWVEELEADAKWMDDQMMAAAPEYGPTLAWSVATSTGAEGYNYDWTEQSMFENATPLQIVNNTGSAPILTVAFKQAKDKPESLEMANYMLEALPRHIRKFIAMAEQNDIEKQRATEVLDRAWPLVMDAAGIMQEKIAPSLDARQSVFSMAGDWMVDNLGPAGPLPNAMPLPEFAFACQVTNQDLFISGCTELYEVFDRAVELIRDVNPGAVPVEYSIPRPVEESIQGGHRFYYNELTQSVPVTGFNPQLAINNDVVVLGYSQRQVDDMLDSHNTRVQPAWVTPNSPAASVGMFDIAKLTTTIRPWAKFAIEANLGSLDEPLAPAPGPVPTGNDILQMWDCLTSLGKFVGSSTVTDEYVVSRWVWIEQ